MLKVTKAQLHNYLVNGGEDYNASNDNPLPALLVGQLKDCDISDIVSGQEMSEDRLGGDDLVCVADKVVDDLLEGYQIVTWYGENAEALVAGYREDEIEIVGS